jgi:hypothetical protein
MTSLSNILIQGNVILYLFLFNQYEFYIDLNRIVVNIADKNSGGEIFKNGSWTGALGLIFKNVC